MVKAYAQDLRGLLEEADFTERKAFFRSFIKRMEIDKEQVKLYYHLPLPQAKGKEEVEEVLPLDTPGGPFGTVPELFFEKKQLIPALQQLLIACLKT